MGLQSLFSSKLSGADVVQNNAVEGEDSALIYRVIKQREWCQETENELCSLDIRFFIDMYYLYFKPLEKTLKWHTNFSSGLVCKLVLSIVLALIMQ